MDAGLGRRSRCLRLLSAAIIVVVIAAACGQTTPAAGTSIPTSSQAAVESGVQSPALSTGPCIDVANLADVGEPVEIAMTNVKTSLAAQKLDDARAAATSAASGMRAVASVVGSASPAAKAQFLAAADEIEKAKDQFPAGTDLVDQAKDDLEKAFATAREASC